MTDSAQHNAPRFELGRIFTTSGILDNCTGDVLNDCLARHLKGDWGCVCEEDRATNDEALRCGDRIISAYPIDPAKPSKGFGDNTFWIVTEADRSATTFLLPEEY